MFYQGHFRMIIIREMNVNCHDNIIRRLDLSTSLVVLLSSHRRLNIICIRISDKCVLGCVGGSLCRLRELSRDEVVICHGKKTRRRVVAGELH